MSLPELSALTERVRGSDPGARSAFESHLALLCELSSFVRTHGTSAAASSLLAAGHALEALANAGEEVDALKLRDLAAGLLEVVLASMRDAAPLPEPEPTLELRVTSSSEPLRGPEPRAVEPEPSASAEPPVPRPMVREREGNPLLGAILLKLGRITRPQLATGLRMHRQKGMAVGECLLLTGACTPGEVLEALKLQRRLRDGREEPAASPSTVQAPSSSGPEAPALRSGPSSNAAMQVTTDMFLGEVLLGAEMIDNDQLETAMRIHHLEGLRVGEALVRIGALTEEALEDGLALQAALRGIALKTARPTAPVGAPGTPASAL